jgi:hypothetical protein
MEAIQAHAQGSDNHGGGGRDLDASDAMELNLQAVAPFCLETSPPQPRSRYEPARALMVTATSRLAVARFPRVSPARMRSV